MSIDERVFEALAESGRVAELVARTGLEVKQVQNACQHLRHAGRAVRSGRVWSRSEGESRADAAAPARRRRGRKGGRKSRGGTPRVAPVQIELDDPLVFAVDSDGDLLIFRRDGEGETATVPANSAQKLRDFLNRCGELLPQQCRS